MNSILFSLVPVGAAILAATIAAFHRPNAAVRGITQHLAAGVVIAAVALELGPDLLKRHQSLSTAVGFTVGVLGLLALRSLSSKAEAGQSKDDGFSVSYVGTVAADLLVDGLMIGIGFITGAKAGYLLTLGLTLELVSLGLALVGQLQSSLKSKPKVVGAVAALSLSLPVGAAIGSTVLPRVPEVILNGTVAGGAAALLFLATEELLREAHEEPDSPLITATFFVGFLAVLLIDMQLG